MCTGVAPADNATRRLIDGRANDREKRRERQPIPDLDLPIQGQAGERFEGLIGVWMTPDARDVRVHERGLPHGAAIEQTQAGPRPEPAQ